MRAQASSAARACARRLPRPAPGRRLSARSREDALGTASCSARAWSAPARVARSSCRQPLQPLVRPSDCDWSPRLLGVRGRCWASVSCWRTSFTVDATVARWWRRSTSTGGARRRARRRLARRRRAVDGRRRRRRAVVVSPTVTDEPVARPLVMSFSASVEVGAVADLVAVGDQDALQRRVRRAARGLHV